MLRNLYRAVWPVITYEWCMIGMGERWEAKLCKCRNGTPVGSGWFLEYIKYSSEEDCRADLKSLLDYIRDCKNPETAHLRNHV